MRLRALVMMVVVLAVAVASSPTRTQTAYAESSRSAHEVDVDGCSREISGGVRRVLHSIVFHELTSPPYALPVSAMGPSCPLHPARSLYEPHETLKNRQGPENWACASCGKAFVSEHFLDVHLAAHHRHLVEGQRTTGGATTPPVCLADYAGLLHLPQLDPDPLPSLSLGRDVYAPLCGSASRLQAGMRKCSALASMCFTLSPATYDSHSALRHVGSYHQLAARMEAFRQDFETAFCGPALAAACDAPQDSHPDLDALRLRREERLGSWSLPSVQTALSLLLIVILLYAALAVACSNASVFGYASSIAAPPPAPHTSHTPYTSRTYASSSSSSSTSLSRRVRRRRKL